MESFRDYRNAAKVSCSILFRCFMDGTQDFIKPLVQRCGEKSVDFPYLFGPKPPHRYLQNIVSIKMGFCALRKRAKLLFLVGIYFDGSVVRSIIDTLQSIDIPHFFTAPNTAPVPHRYHNDRCGDCSPDNKLTRIGGTHCGKTGGTWLGRSRPMPCGQHRAALSAYPPWGTVSVK